MPVALVTLLSSASLLSVHAHSSMIAAIGAQPDRVTFVSQDRSMAYCRKVSNRNTLKSSPPSGVSARSRSVTAGGIPTTGLHYLCTFTAD